ncbi:MAG TPA: hypothetical protein DEB09_03950 [Candidatus Magasanikbacteria bacterium]|nr:hypothetical protein [Candidatus Magasanikbacteria bacterium]
MEYKKALNILLKMLNKYSFTTEEKDAMITAVGTLDCGSLMDNRFKGIIKSRKKKQAKDLEL